MSKLYRIFRWTGYVAGILGLVFVLGGRMNPTQAPWMLKLGGLLLLVMFCSFLVTYFIYFAGRFNRPTR